MPGTAGVVVLVGEACGCTVTAAAGAAVGGNVGAVVGSDCGAAVACAAGALVARGIAVDAGVEIPVAGTALLRIITRTTAISTSAPMIASPSQGLRLIRSGA